MEHDYDLLKAKAGAKKCNIKSNRKSMRRFMAILLSAVLAAGICLPAMAVEQPEIQTEEASGAASNDTEQVAEVEPEEVIEETGADENEAEEASGGTENVTAVEDQDTVTADRQTEDEAEIIAEDTESTEDAESTEVAGTAETTDSTTNAEIAAEVEPEKNAVTDDGALAGTSGETSNWLADYDYNILGTDTGEDYVLLESYLGADTEVTVPGTAQVEGQTYQVTAHADLWNSYPFEKITLGSGFLLPDYCDSYFASAESLVSVDISAADASNVVFMNYMFSGCSNLQDVNLGKINVYQLREAGYMFSDCSSLEEIEINCFSVSHAYEFSGMFSGCSNLRRADLGGCYWGDCWYVSDVFDGCVNLEEIVTPEYIRNSCDLPVCMADESGNLYTSLPQLSGSITLHAVEVPSWLSDYRFRIVDGEQAISLEEYYGLDSEIIVPASTNWGEKEYQIKLSGDCPWEEGVTSLSFEEGCAISGYNYRFFSDMKDLQILDLRNVDFSDLRNMEEPIVGCDDLQYLYLPANMSFVFKLGRVFVDDNNNTYTEVPQGLPYSITLRPGFASEWLEGYSYSISDNTIQLENYLGNQEDIVVGSSAEINGTTYSKVSFWRSCWRGSDIRSIAFEDGVIFPESLTWMFENFDQLESVNFGTPAATQIVSIDALFEGCHNLREADLSGLDLSGCEEYASHVFLGCSALETISFPAGVVSDIELPGPFVNENGTIYTSIPKNLDQSINLTRAEMSDWLEKYHFEVSGDRIILLRSKTGYGPGYDYGDYPVIYTVPGSAEIGTSQFNKIELSKGLWGAWQDLRELSFEQGVILPADCEGLFDYCDFEKIDLSQVEVSNAENMNSMFSNCYNLETIITPKNVTLNAGLPGVFADENNRTYCNLPKNLSDSITLTKTVAGNWLDDYDFYVSGNKIVLMTYKGHDTDVTVPGSVTLGDTVFNIIEITENVFDDYRYEHGGSSETIKHLSFGKGVQFPADSTRLFFGSYNLESISLTNVDTSNVTNMSEMFANCRYLTSLDLSGFDTSNVADMSYMFANCENLTSLDLSGFDTSNVTSMGEMFYYCTSLTSLNLNGFDTSKVIDMSEMFYKCSNLTSLDVSMFDTRNVTNIVCTFEGCDSLLELDLSNWDLSSLSRVGRHTFSGKTPVIRTPVNVPMRVELWGVYTGSDGLTYDILPIDTETSILLTWISESGDSHGHISGDPIWDSVSIGSQPQDVEAKEGEQVTFSVGVSAANPTFQWQWSKDGETWKNSTAAGCNTDTFSFTMSAKYAGRIYRCVVSNGINTAYSRGALLSLKVPVEIISDPEDVSVKEGEQATFTVVAEGENLSYQWQWSKDGVTWKNSTAAGYNTDTFSFKMNAKYAGRQYRCMVTDGNETFYSKGGLLSLKALISIISGPEDVSAQEGEQATFTVVAEGENLSYQWQWSKDGVTWKNSTAAGCNTDTLSFKMNAKYAGRQYRCMVTDGTETAYTEGGLLSLKALISIISEPEDVRAKEGNQATFTVAAEGENLSYQWQWSKDGTTWKNSTAAGYNTDTFSFKMSAKYAGRQYRCMITNGTDTVYTRGALLSVAGAIEIVSEPEDVSVRVGEPATFAVAAEGENLSYRWQWSKDGVTWKNSIAAGYNTDTFSFTMNAKYEGRRYRCMITDGTETVYTRGALLSVISN